MNIDDSKIDDAVLALLWLTLHDERRAWKNFDWDTMTRLFRRKCTTLAELIEPVGNAAWFEKLKAPGPVRRKFGEHCSKFNEITNATSAIDGSVLQNSH